MPSKGPDVPQEADQKTSGDEFFGWAPSLKPRCLHKVVYQEKKCRQTIFHGQQLFNAHTLASSGYAVKSGQAKFSEEICNFSES
jgi:hypothetical protein